MQVSYGSPGHRGVTTLMAVGDDVGESPTENAVRTGRWFALGVAAIGALSGSRSIRDVGLGAAFALFVIRACADRANTVAVTTPAPAPSGWW